jgi:hypothetical protein
MCVMPESRCNWASIAAGTLKSTVTSRRQACCCSSVNHRGWSMEAG